MSKRKPPKPSIETRLKRLEKGLADLKDLVEALPVGECGDVERGCLDEAGLARFLKLGKRTVVRMRERGQIPFHQLGTRIRYSAGQVQKILENSEKLNE